MAVKLKISEIVVNRAGKVSVANLKTELETTKYSEQKKCEGAAANGGSYSGVFVRFVWLGSPKHDAARNPRNRPGLEISLQSRHATIKRLLRN